MTCFWDGILRSLEPNDRVLLELGEKADYHDLIERLKRKNVLTDGLRWQGVPLSQKQLEENRSHVSEFVAGSAPQGYLCSTFDPFLLLSHLLRKKIAFSYCNHLIEIEPTGESNGTLRYSCNASHFWANGF